MDETDDSSLRKKHIALIQADTKSLEESEVSGTPIFTESVRQHGNNASTSNGEIFTQYGLLGGDVAKLHASKDMKLDIENDPRVFYNIKAPSSVFICGSQGSGKSHTLSCLLENCLIPTDANTLPRPLTGILFHYDPFFSDNRGQRCEAASISSHAGVKVRVLCPPTNVGQIKVSEKYKFTKERGHTSCILITRRNCINRCQMLKLRSCESASETSIPNECWILWQSAPFKEEPCHCICIS